MNEIDNQIMHSGVIDERAQLIGGWLNHGLNTTVVVAIVFLVFVFFFQEKLTQQNLTIFKRGKGKHFA